mmetsp:Transcript_3250/g.10215  ORF Transcript_3250/g.10215 Transcript_3250/m.10215 type:complete len:257 (+) Transcript_3250:985-1755(+)
MSLRACTTSEPCFSSACALSFARRAALAPHSSRNCRRFCCCASRHCSDCAWVVFAHWRSATSCSSRSRSSAAMSRRFCSNSLSKPACAPEARCWCSSESAVAPFSASVASASRALASTSCVWVLLRRSSSSLIRLTCSVLRVSASRRSSASRFEAARISASAAAPRGPVWSTDACRRSLSLAKSLRPRARRSSSSWRALPALAYWAFQDPSSRRSASDSASISSTCEFSFFSSEPCKASSPSTTLICSCIAAASAA